MSLVNTEVDVHVIPKTQSYYKSKGYNIPDKITRDGINIKVKINDLSLGSTVEVETFCDECGRISKMTYQNYLRRNHDGKTYCNKCAHKVLRSGENNNKWNPNLTDEERINRRSYPEYLEFCRKTKIRDNFMCQCCGSQRNLEVHHLNGYSWDIENRLNIKNAITLCKTCHNHFHSIYGKDHNTKEQYEEWINKTINVLDYTGELPPTEEVICLETKKIFKSVKDAAKSIDTLPSIIYKCCLRQESRIRYNGSTKSVKGFHFLYLTDYQSMTEEEWKEYNNWINTKKSFVSKNHRHSNIRKIICLETEEIFEAICDAANKYNLSVGGLTDCCKGRYKHCGKLEDGTKMTWMYYEDYLQKIA